MSIKLTINGKRAIIPQLSELSVKDFCEIVEKNINVDAISYINAITGQDIMSSQAEFNVDLDKIDGLLLDVDIDFSKLPVPNLIQIGEDNFLIKELDDKTFGKRYTFNMYKSAMQQGKTSITQLCVYALALMMSKTDNAKEINDYYEKLIEMNWTKVLPAGFFLSKQLTRTKPSITKFFKQLIIRLNYIGKYLMLKFRHKKIHTIS